MAIEEVYLDLLTPALRSVGDRWESGEITVADEHVASAITLRLIGRLGPAVRAEGPQARHRRGGRAGRRDPQPARSPCSRTSSGGGASGCWTSAATCPPTRWRRSWPGPDNLLAVCLGCTTTGNEALDRRGHRRRASRHGRRVLVGGQAIADPAMARSLGADDGGMSTDEALDLIEHLPRCGLRDPSRVILAAAEVRGRSSTAPTAA